MALYELYKKGMITVDEALRNADSRNNLSLKIRLDNTDSDSMTDDDMQSISFDD